MALKVPAMLLATALIAAGCTTTPYEEGFGAWHEIDPANSTIAVALPTDTQVTIQRRDHKFDGTLVENWNWGTGTLSVLKYGQNISARDTFRSAEDLTWQLSDGTISVEDAQVNRGVNRLGAYVYAAIEGESGSCFVYSQGYPFGAGGANYHNPTEGSQGYVRGIDCQQGLNGEEITALFLPIIESMYVQ